MNRAPLRGEMLLTLPLAFLIGFLVPGVQAVEIDTQAATYSDGWCAQDEGE